ncbi:MAG: NAD-dependent epimerase/dehydratase family protein [Jatrophihabitans sp.]|uniref:NAD-dependent epimerase/dehydratase family protein n=1 Tax=Jatrophihabitans sp. TaxID=1932789 RepID=UPI003F7EE67A
MTTVLVTGAAGAVGGALLQRLPALGHTVRGLDRVPLDDPSADCRVGDITSPADLDAAMAGVDSVVHLAGRPNEVPWPEIREANIEGTFQVFEAARRAGVGRVVFASSNHAVGFTPNPPTGEQVPDDLLPRPDTLYGVSKAFGEALGRYYAERYGLRVACLRIGYFGDRPHDERTLSAWLSPGDCARLVDACLTSPDLTWAVVWGVSANTRRQWSLAGAEALGYRPQDDAEAFAGAIGDGVTAAAGAPLGGAFATAEYGLDEVAARWAHQPW